MIEKVDSLFILSFTLCSSRVGPKYDFKISLTKQKTLLHQPNPFNRGPYNKPLWAPLHHDLAHTRGSSHSLKWKLDAN